MWGLYTDQGATLVAEDVDISRLMQITGHLTWATWIKIEVTGWCVTFTSCRVLGKCYTIRKLIDA